MKKKFLYSSVVVMITLLAVFAEDSKFSNALKSCSSYNESGVVNTEGMNVSSQKQILGWENDRCVYKETINMAGINATITCKLNPTQIQELTSVMDAYSLVNKYSDKSVDTANLSSVQDNPVVKVWNKYLQDSSTCVLSGL